MKIAIFTICLGNYDIFFDDFYESVNNLFLPEHEKTFYVVTDKPLKDRSNLKQYHKEKMGWPYDTMMRFHLMDEIKEDLSDNDYMYFFNVNMLVLREIGDEVIPNEENDFLMGCDHPIHFNWPDDQKPLDRNPKCSCYIPYGTKMPYYQGCFNGGRTKEFLKMSKILKTNIDEDIKNEIIPLWHDESQLNWYYLKYNPKRLPFTYIFPESFGNINTKIFMIQRDKNKHGGHQFLRS